MLHIPTGLRSVAVLDVDSVLTAAGLKWVEELETSFGQNKAENASSFLVTLVTIAGL